VSALLAMLCSCAAGVAVVNIDDGFGAGTIAGADRALGRRRRVSRVCTSTASAASPATCCSARCSTRAPTRAVRAGSRARGRGLELRERR
jgi:hypothetical protein